MRILSVLKEVVYLLTTVIKEHYLLRYKCVVMEKSIATARTTELLEIFC
jgi:hypothetical protein